MGYIYTEDDIKIYNVDVAKRHWIFDEEFFKDCLPRSRVKIPNEFLSFETILKNFRDREQNMKVCVVIMTNDEDESFFFKGFHLHDDIWIFNKDKLVAYIEGF